MIAASLRIDFAGVSPDMRLATNQRRNLLATRGMTPKQVMGRLYAMERADKKRWGWEFKAHRDWLALQAWFRHNAPPYRFTWHVRFRDSVNRDADGVMSALKTCIDAMVEVGLLPNDRGQTIPSQTIELEFGCDNMETRLLVEQIGGVRRLPL